ncbi:MAG: hypothetical protein EOO50_05730 [Flavobacterium sp.]|uniref:hypothetical protein n=1 Tax=Flavobacterium sp. TaxID=239 RepID=UPI001208BBB3|nr:hypothetical protein [Flavobacterium sp.]RZJ67485.1 MAG: hypothetical protein EOO50_05730 [Flavobacterium sp.]
MKNSRRLIATAALALLTLTSCRYSHIDNSDTEESNPSVPTQEPAQTKKVGSASISQADTIDTKSSNPPGNVKPNTTGTEPDE